MNKDGFPEVLRDTVPSLSEEQMREVDRIMIEDLRIGLVQMMENAGSHLAEVAIRCFAPVTASILAGVGGNGGGGLVAARHLVNRGVDVSVVLGSEEGRLGEVPTRQLNILRRMGISVDPRPRDADVVIDALIGYSLKGAPHGMAAELIAWSGGQTAPVLSLDIPSGLGATGGEVHDPCVVADVTVTLALPKTGLYRSPEVVGQLFLADISVPPSAYAGLGVEAPSLFAAGRIVHLI